MTVEVLSKSENNSILKMMFWRNSPLVLNQKLLVFNCFLTIMKYGDAGAPFSSISVNKEQKRDYYARYKTLFSI